MKILLLFGLFFLISGCSTMSAEECKVAQWEYVGQKDASEGYDRLRFAKYTKACNKAHVIPNQELYNKGYDAGLKLYCTPQNIFDLGLSGGGDYSICPIEIQSQLRPYADVSNSYHSAKEAKNKVIKDISYYENLLKGKDLKEDVKESYKRSLNNLENQRMRITRDFYNAEDTMERFRRANNLKAC